MRIIEKKTGELHPYERNPRNNDGAVDAVAASIKEFGFKVPVVIDTDDVIVAGHTRVKAAKKLGLKTVPCIVADDLTPEQVKAFRLADNKVGELAEWDFSKLGEELLALADMDLDFSMSDFGFDVEDSIPDVDPEMFEDEAPEVDEVNPPVTQLGDIWMLGNHRLMCGDSTKAEDVTVSMDGKKSDMVFTDPPYLMGFEGNVHADGTKSFNAKHGAIKNDKMSREEGDKFILDIFKTIKTFNKGAYYVCFYRLGLDYIFRALNTVNNKYKALIIWDKGNHTLSNSDYMSKYEPIVYGWIDEHNFYGDRSNFDIWNIARTSKNELHPTMKPIELCAKAIKNSSKCEDVVLDLFGGSGSTLIACEQLNRTCYMMELDPKYCDVIIKRWENLTGKKAELIEGRGIMTEGGLER